MLSRVMTERAGVDDLLTVLQADPPGFPSGREPYWEKLLGEESKLYRVRTIEKRERGGKRARKKEDL